MLLNDKQQQQGLFLTLLLFAFFLPLLPRVATYTGAVGLLICLLNPRIYLRLKRSSILEILAFSTPLLIWLPALFMGYPVSGKVETKIGLFLLPLVFYLLDKDDLSQTLKLFKSYFLGLCVSAVYTLAAASITFISTGANNFFYSKLGAYLHFHPTYFSLYLILGICFFLIALRKKLLDSREVKIGWIASVLFTVLILLLSSRSQWINFLIFIPLLVFPLLKDRLGGLKAMLVFSISGVFFLSAIYAIPATNKRLMDIFKSKEPDQSAKITNVRYQTWDASLKLFKDKPLVGVGVQNLQQEQLNMYETLDYERPFREKYNAHNQYLDLLAGAGLLPLCFWLICLFWQRSFNKQYFKFYTTALSVFLLSFITESMLETARGVMLFSFVMGLLMVSIKWKEYEV